MSRYGQNSIQASVETGGETACWPKLQPGLVSRRRQLTHYGQQADHCTPSHLRLREKREEPRR